MAIFPYSDNFFAILAVYIVSLTVLQVIHPLAYVSGPFFRPIHFSLPLLLTFEEFSEVSDSIDPSLGAFAMLQTVEPHSLPHFTILGCHNAFSIELPVFERASEDIL